MERAKSVLVYGGLGLMAVGFVIAAVDHFLIEGSFDWFAVPIMVLGGISFVSGFLMDIIFQ